jgi:SAM-dependent methyltransferase
MPNTKFTETFYPESRFGGFSDVDGSISFFTRINALLDPAWTVLDVGCGRGEYAEDTVPYRRALRILKGKVAKVIGLDVDPVGRQNPCLNEFRLLESETWPVESDSIDLIICDQTLEHVPNPDALFSEARRTLRNGGYLCIRTPNRWGYPALVATVVPNKHHARVVGAVQENRMAHDVFPTVYRCNSKRKVLAAMRKHGFDAVVYGYDAEPSYLAFSRIAFRLGMLYMRLSPPLPRAVLFAFGKLTKRKG